MVFDPSRIMRLSDLNISRATIILYGGPGMAKTPVAIDTSPNAIVCLSEPGGLSVRRSPVPAYPAFTSAHVEDFVTWACSSAEASRYETLVFDSISQIAEKKVEEQLSGSSKGGNEMHGQRAYGAMSRWMMEQLNKLYFQQRHHVVLVAKLQNFEINGGVYKRPYFPGRELPVRVPHLFDFVVQIGNYNVPGVTPSPTKAFLCHEQFDSMARDRSGLLAQYEPPHVGKLITKVFA